MSAEKERNAGPLSGSGIPGNDDSPLQMLTVNALKDERERKVKTLTGKLGNQESGNALENAKSSEIDSSNFIKKILGNSRIFREQKLS